MPRSTSLSSWYPGQQGPSPITGQNRREHAEYQETPHNGRSNSQYSMRLSPTEAYYQAQRMHPSMSHTYHYTPSHHRNAQMQQNMMAHYQHQQQQSLYYNFHPSYHQSHMMNPHHMYGEYQHLDSREGQIHHSDSASPRSPSPPMIPPPPSSARKQQPKEQPASEAKVPRKLENEEDFGGALRVSVHPNIVGDGSAGNKKVEEPPRKKNKKEAATDEASLLLGLRTKGDDGSPMSTSEETETTPKREGPKEPEEKAPAVVESPPHIIPVTPKDNNADSLTTRPLTVPTTYPKRLAMPNDIVNVNNLHCYIRSDLLDLFVIPFSSDIEASNSMAGRVGLQCLHCARARIHDPKRTKEATMAVFYPKSVGEIYRLVTNWTRCHLRKCRNLPADVQAKLDRIRATDKSRGKTSFWADSAKDIGLMDCHRTKVGGVRFHPDLYNPISAPKQQDKEGEGEIVNA